MNNILKRLFVCAIILMLVFAAGCTVNITTGRDSDGKEKSRYDEGTLLTFEPAGDRTSADITDEEKEAVVSVLRLRLDTNGYSEAIVNPRKNNQGICFEVWIPVTSTESVHNIATYLSSSSRLSFRDGDGNELIGSKHIADAKAVTLGGKEMVMLYFTEEGRKVFAEVTAENVGNQINIYVDDILISAPMVNEAMDSDTCVIEGDFTKDAAEQLANQLKSGTLPFELVLVSSSLISA